jgi:hypothetical protein
MAWLAPQRNVPFECPVRDVVCPEASDPVQCSIARRAGRRLPPGQAIFVWGANDCAGRLAAARAACSRGFMPVEVDAIDCVPDASNGHCPRPPTACGAPEGAPVRCAADSYAGNPLPEGRALKAWGASDCAATLELEISACRANLDPKLLGKRRCGPDPTHGECPMPAFPCNEPARPAVCVVTRLAGRADVPNLRAAGASACEAKDALMQALCAADVAPSSVEEFACRFERP